MQHNIEWGENVLFLIDIIGTKFNFPSDRIFSSFVKPEINIKVEMFFNESSLIIF